MLIGQGILWLFINLVIYLVAGAIIYETIRWAILNIIIPISKFNAYLTGLPDLLSSYAQAYANSEYLNRQDIVKITNSLCYFSAQVITGRDMIPGYDYWAKMTMVISREQINELLQCLKYLTDAIHEANAGENNTEKVQETLSSIEKCLGIDKGLAVNKTASKEPLVKSPFN